MRYFWILFCCTFLCVACGKLNSNSSEKIEGKITEASNFPPDELEMASISDSLVYHIAGNESMPKISIKVNINYPMATGVSGNDKLLMNDFFKNCLSKKSANFTEADKAIKSFIDENVNIYKKEVCGDKPENKVKGEEWMNYETVISNTIYYNAHGILSYSSNSYHYTGGAHGLSNKACYVYDFYDNMEITTSNIFNEESIPAILSLIKEKLAQLDFAESIDMENVSVTENFYADADGICWVYNPYEIAPYSYGCIEVKLPFDEIEEYFLENSPINSIY